MRIFFGKQLIGRFPCYSILTIKVPTTKRNQTYCPCVVAACAAHIKGSAPGLHTRRKGLGHGGLVGTFVDGISWNRPSFRPAAFQFHTQPCPKKCPSLANHQPEISLNLFDFFWRPNAPGTGSTAGNEMTENFLSSPFMSFPLVSLPFCLIHASLTSSGSAFSIATARPLTSL